MSTRASIPKKKATSSKTSRSKTKVAGREIEVSPPVRDISPKLTGLETDFLADLIPPGLAYSKYRIAPSKRDKEVYGEQLGKMAPMLQSVVHQSLALIDKDPKAVKSALALAAKEMAGVDRSVTAIAAKYQVKDWKAVLDKAGWEYRISSVGTDFPVAGDMWRNADNQE